MARRTNIRGGEAPAPRPDGPPAPEGFTPVSGITTPTTPDRPRATPADMPAFATAREAADPLAPNRPTPFTPEAQAARGELLGQVRPEVAAASRMGTLRSGEPAVRTPVGDAWDRHVNAFTLLHTSVAATAAAHVAKYSDDVIRNMGYRDRDQATSAVHDILMDPSHPQSFFNQTFTSHDVRRGRGGQNQVNIGGTWHPMKDDVAHTPSGPVVGITRGRKWHTANANLLGGSVQGVEWDNITAQPPAPEGGAPSGYVHGVPDYSPEEQEVHDAGMTFNKAISATTLSKRGKKKPGRVADMTAKQWDDIKTIAWSSVGQQKAAADVNGPDSWKQSPYWRKIAVAANRGFGTGGPSIRGTQGADPGPGYEADIAARRVREAASAYATPLTAIAQDPVRSMHPAYGSTMERAGQVFPKNLTGADRLVELGRHIWGRDLLVDPESRLGQFNPEASPGNANAAIKKFVGQAQVLARLHGVQVEELPGNHLRGVAEGLMKEHPVAEGSEHLDTRGNRSQSATDRWGNWREIGSKPEDLVQEMRENLGETSRRRLGSTSLMPTRAFKAAQTDPGDYLPGDEPATRGTGRAPGTSESTKHLTSVDTEEAAAEKAQEEKEEAADEAAMLSAYQAEAEKKFGREVGRAKTLALKDTRRQGTFEAAVLQQREAAILAGAPAANVTALSQASHSRLRAGFLALPSTHERAVAIDTPRNKTAEENAEAVAKAHDARAIAQQILDAMDAGAQRGPNEAGTLSTRTYADYLADQQAEIDKIKAEHHAVRQQALADELEGADPSKHKGIKAKHTRRWKRVDAQVAQLVGKAYSPEDLEEEKAPEYYDEVPGYEGMSPREFDRAVLARVGAKLDVPPHWTQQASTEYVPQREFKGKGVAETAAEKKEREDKAAAAASRAAWHTETGIAEPTPREVDRARKAGKLEGVTDYQTAVERVHAHTRSIEEAKAARAAKRSGGTTPEAEALRAAGPVSTEDVQALAQTFNTPQQTEREPGGKPSQRTGPSRTAHFSDGMNSGS